MNNLIIILTTIGVVLALYSSITTLVETRQKYFEEYLNRKFKDRISNKEISDNE